jgi:hypothetical protein
MEATVAVFMVFCELFELQGWLSDLSREKDLGGLLFNRDEEAGKRIGPGHIALTDNTFMAFLFPNAERLPKRMVLDDVRTKDWGWMTVSPGRLWRTDEGTVLLMSQSQGASGTALSTDSAPWVRWLKRRAKKEAHQGVVMRHIPSGDTSSRSDIWYTPKAKALLASGVSWKQFVDAPCVFEPLPDSAAV